MIGCRERWEGVGGMESETEIKGNNVVTVNAKGN